MAFTVTFPTTGALPTVAELAAWLVEQGEPFDADGHELALKALPLRLVRADEGLQGWIDVGAKTPLPRLVDLLFALSVRAGADVRLAGHPEVNRASLWLIFADEQDRMRLGAALESAALHGNADEVNKRLWACLSALQPGHDLRWDAAQKRVVELVEVGAPGGMAVEDAKWLDERVVTGDAVSSPAQGPVHVLAWRFVSQAWPGLAE